VPHNRRRSLLSRRKAISVRFYIIRYPG
jgi:hypothetical protein